MGVNRPFLIAGDSFVPVLESSEGNRRTLKELTIERHFIFKTWPRRYYIMFSLEVCF